MAKRILRMATMIVATSALAACTGGRESFGEMIGATVSSPDPFNVVPAAPLRLPPSFSELPPPQPGAPSPLAPQPIVAARAALANAGEPPSGAVAPSPGEQRLLGAAGAAQADPNVRAELDAGAGPKQQSKYGLSSLFGLKVPDGSEDEILTPREEALRIKEKGAPTPNPPPPPPPRKTNSFTLGG